MNYVEWNEFFYFHADNVLLLHAEKISVNLVNIDNTAIGIK